MSLTVRTTEVKSAEELYNECNAPTVHKYAHELKENRISFDQLPREGKKIGTIDATDCIGILYKTSRGELYVQHYDGGERRKEGALTDIFQQTSFTGSSPVEVTLIGGLRTRNSRGEIEQEFKGLHKKTQSNIEELVAVWKKYNCNITIQGWAVGDASNNYSSLCPDFVADSQRIYLLNPQSIGERHYESSGTLIPEFPRRFAVMSFNPQYHYVYKSGSNLEIPNLTEEQQKNGINDTAIFSTWNDEDLIKKTSNLKDAKVEPSYYCKNMRTMAQFLKDSQSSTIEAYTVPIAKDQPIIGLQGEIVSLLPDKKL